MELSGNPTSSFCICYPCVFCILVSGDNMYIVIGDKLDLCNNSVTSLVHSSTNSLLIKFSLFLSYFLSFFLSSFNFSIFNRFVL